MDLVYTSNQTIAMPEIEIKNIDSSYVLVPLRGYGYLLAVFDIDDICIGYTTTDNLGYENVKDWMLKTKWFDGGY